MSRSDYFAIDFETFYDSNVNIMVQGSHHYVRHPNCDVYMVSVVNDDFEWVGHPEEFNWDLLKDKHLVAHNMAFDGTVLKYLQEKGLVPHSVGSAGLHCTADLAAYFQMPRNLKGASEQMLGGYEEIDKFMRNYAKGRYWHEMDDLHKEKMLDYALKDSQACWRLWKQWSHKWPKEEQEVSRHTRKMMWEGVNIDENLLTAYTHKMKRQHWEAQQKIPWADAEPILSRKAFDLYCQDEGITPPKSLAQDNVETQQWMHKNNHIPWIEAMTTWRKTNTFVQKLESIENRVRLDGRMSPELKYFGAAATGRWSGAGGVNMQNLPRGRVFDVDFRKVFIPEPGKKFIICDLSQIEPRCLAWIVGDHDLLQDVRNGWSIYESHARQFMNWNGGKLKDENDNLYRLAKARVLGAGYGAGAAKFQIIAKTMCDLHLTEKQCRKAINEYRDTNTKVTRGWRMLEQGMRNKYGAVKGGAENIYEVTCPSGREIRYFDIMKDPTGMTALTTRGEQKRRFHWYGGKLIENLIQGTARDVMRDCILNVERAGFPVKWHVHDEVICEVDLDVKPEDVEAVMKQDVPWMPGLPVDAEAFEAQHYTK